MNRQNRKLHRTLWCFRVNWRHRKLEQVPHKVVFRNMNWKKAFYHETPPYIHGLLQLKMHINLYKTIKEEILFHKDYQQWQFIYFPLLRAAFTIFTRLEFENHRCLALRLWSTWWSWQALKGVCGHHRIHYYVNLICTMCHRIHALIYILQPIK